MKNNNWLKRLTSLVLCTVMILGMIPSVTADAAERPVIVPTNGQIVDLPTVTNWRKVFPDDNTSNAGGVWTDKSVFTSEEKYLEAISDEEKFSRGTVKVGENNFMVSLSAIASTKSIVGYTSIPTDTVLVLDMSSSMKNSESVDDLAAATNEAIKALTAANYNNRVGVVLYSSEPRGTVENYTNVLMPLDRYSTTDVNGNFIEFYGKVNKDSQEEADHGLRVVDGVTGDVHKDVAQKSDGWHTGTFTQDGIYTAMKMFLKANTKVETGIQAGKERMPIMVLMTDGEPYRSSNLYHGSDGTLEHINYKENGRNGYDSDVEFLTQLTAAYAKYRLDNKYTEHDMLFYTLGMGVSHTAILDPQNSNEKDNTATHWTEFLATTDGTYQKGDNINVTSPSSFFAALTNNATQNRYRYYVDKYYSANNANNLNAIFKNIVDEIILQSKYYPTQIQIGDDAHFGGYVTIADTLGDYMEVKDIKGFHLGNQLYTGAQFAHTLVTGSGSIENPNLNGDEFIRSVRERIGIGKEEAQALVGQAWQTGQLYYNTDWSFSNYIGWYGSTDDSINKLNYHGHWDGVKDKNKAPADAEYYVKSYFFYGESGTGTRRTDMMYTAVHVQEDIDTGLTKVYCRLPASLIPLREYDVVLDDENLQNPTELKVTTNVFPARLLFEVGLQEDINSINIAEKVKNPAPVIEDGKYVFYSNKWGTTESSPLADNTHVYFFPSVENERYYYHSDSLIYTKKDINSLYKGGSAPGGNREYYTIKYVYTGTGTNVNCTLEFEEIIPSRLELARRTNEGDSNSTWYIPRGTHRLYEARAVVNKKDENGNDLAGGLTKTYNSSEYPVVVHNHSNGVTSDYHLEAVLGNNGKLYVEPMQGIRISKYFQNVEGGETVSNAQTYEFKVKSTGTALTGRYTVYIVDGVGANLTNIGDGQSITVNSDGEIVISGVKASQSAVIADLPAGSYTVTETVSDDDKFMISDIRLDGVSKGPTNGLEVEVKADNLTGVAFLNANRTFGSLSIQKTVDSDHQPHHTKEFDFSFELTATLPIEGNSAYIGVDYPVNITDINAATSKIGDIKFTQADGAQEATANFSFKLSDTEALQIPKLPNGATVTVTETRVNKNGGNNTVTTQTFTTNTGAKEYGFTTTVTDTTGVTTDNASRKATATIANNGRAHIHFNNAYQADIPIAPNNITVMAVKNFTGRPDNEWLKTDSFSFNIERSDLVGSLLKDNAVIGKETQDKKVTLSENGINLGTYSAAKTYSYKIFEILPRKENRIAGVSYDTTAKYFDVVVEDDGFGKLKIADVKISTSNDTTSAETTNTNLITVTGNATEGWVVTATFENKYENLGRVDLDLGITKNITTDSGSPNLDKSGYEFKLYNVTDNYTENNNNTFVGLNLKSLTAVATEKTNANGEADFRDITFTLSDTAMAASNLVFKGDTYLVIDEVKGTRPGVTFSNKIYGIFADVEEITDTASLKVTAYIYEGEKNAEGVITSMGTTEIGKLEKEYTPTGTKTVTLPQNEGNTPTEADSQAEGDTPEEGATVIDTNDQNTQVQAKDPGAIPVIEYNAVFTNTYNPDDATVTITGTKTLIGRDMKDNEFEIGLYDKDNKLIESIKVGADAVNTAKDFSFTPIEYTTVGEFEYTVKEITGTADKVTYDNSEFKVHVSVVNDRATGKLVATQTVKKNNNITNIEFKNTYTPEPLKYNIDVFKELLYTNENRNIPFSKGIFSVGLYDENNNLLKNVPFGAAEGEELKGKATFSFVYGYDDIGEHTYKIRETPKTDGNGQIVNPYNGTTYDLTERTVTVTVSYNNATGRYEANVAFDNNTNVIKNTYTATKTYPPITISGNKTLFDTAFTASSTKDFTFGLFEVDGTFKIADGATAKETKPVTIGKSGEAKSFDFSPLDYDKAGTYHYVVKEIPGNDGLMVYDSNQYNITVSVNDDGKGQLHANTTVESVARNKTVGVNELNFSNTRRHPADITINIGANKTFIGGQSAKGFEFQLNEYTDNTYTTKANNGHRMTTDADGKAVLKNGCVFTEADFGKTFYFEMTETKGSNDNIIYDDAKYRFTVTIGIDHTNSLTATITPVSDYGNKLVITEAKAAATDSEGKEITPAQLRDVTADFTNIYVNPVTIDVMKTVKNTGNAKLSPKGFKFVITETNAAYKAIEGGFTQTVLTDENGNAVFTAIAMKDGETKYFTVAEVNDNQNHVTYDKTVYKIQITRSGRTVTIVSNPKGTQVGTNISMAFENVYNYNTPTPEVTPPPTTPPKQPSSPDTGDSSMAHIWKGMIAVGTTGFLATAAYALRKRKQEN